MVHDRRSPLSGYISRLLASGRAVFTAEEAEHALGVGHGAFLDAAERLQRRHGLLRPRRGFYVIVPPQYQSWGAPPPSWYVDALLRHEKQTYYVGLLKAAEIHGATHQAVMEFQVVSGRRLPRIRAGRNLIVFYFRKNVEQMMQGIEGRKTDTGTMQVSSPALTALDLLRYPRGSGGLDHVSTVLADLACKIDPAQLAALSALVERPAVQRLGHLLDRLGHDTLTLSMLEALRSRGSPPWTELDRQAGRALGSQPEPRERDLRWRVIAHRAPVPDE